MQPQDPIVDEIHAVREALAEQCDHDFAKIAEKIKAEEVASGCKGEPQPPRRIAKKAS